LLETKFSVKPIQVGMVDIGNSNFPAADGLLGFISSHVEVPEHAIGCIDSRRQNI
jgi:hypothetical protein